MNIRDLTQFKKKSIPISCLTAYDASFARLLCDSNLDILLVGDSLGMAISGYKSTLNVTMKQMLYHTKNVSRGIKQSENQAKPLLIGDMPWGSFSNPKKALKNAMKFIRHGANMVKLEGASNNEVETIKLLRNNSIPVCGHLGLEPQSIEMIGGFIRQGKDNNSARIIFEKAKKLDNLGVEIIVLECIPFKLAEKITQSVKATVIGIGTYSFCDGQVLVLYDILGISKASPTFVKNFLVKNNSIEQAINNFVFEVKEKKFPVISTSNEN